MSGLRIAVLGAAGAVGEEMVRLAAGSDLPVSDFLAYTTPRSAGRAIRFRERTVSCRTLDESTFEPVDLVLASAGADASRQWTPRFAAEGAIVVDNSSAFRTDPACPLLVPEVNAHALGESPAVIANPNCSTIQMVVALAPLHRAWHLTAVRVATYQSVSGAGRRAMEELRLGARAFLEAGEEAVEIFPHPIAFNLLPQVGEFDAEGESREERKMRDETRRILDLPELPVSATCVRVPVLRAHSESVWSSFRETPDPARAETLLRDAGVVVGSGEEGGPYPTPRGADGRGEVFVGRMRRDGADPDGLTFWVVSDNLLKGAALNAWQIVELLRGRGFLGRSRP
jgi:aspartate-semialdehyde dehydrogenase